MMLQAEVRHSLRFVCVHVCIRVFVVHMYLQCTHAHT